jgi:penicillin-binding protein 2
MNGRVLIATNEENVRDCRYRLIRWFFGLTILTLLAGCSNPTETAVPTETATLPAPEVFTTARPDARIAAAGYLDAWVAEDLAAMYGMLTASSQAAIAQEQFEDRHQNVIAEATLIDSDYQILNETVDGESALVSYTTILNSAVVGEIRRDTEMRMRLENGQWKIDWNEAMLLPELAGGNRLAMDRVTPDRAAILDRNGNPIAKQAEAAAIGIYPDYIDLEDESSDGLIGLLSNLTGFRSETLIDFVLNAYPGEYVPLGQISSDKDPRRLQILSTYGAVLTAIYNSRLYYGNGAAPHLVGYVSALQPDELEEFKRKGYAGDEKIGRKGIELWGEDKLSGTRGGALYVINPEGKPIAELGSKPSEAGQEITTTLDRDLQLGAQKAMSVFNGAIVVMERDTGRVLAMVSSPGFDPNAYQTENANWGYELDKILSNPDSPQYNRATQGQYPLGSVFKVITLAAAIESGRYTPEYTYECGYVFEELAGFPRYDWTYEHFQEDGETQPSGNLNLQQSLIRSCNPFYWHIGLDLFDQGLTTAIADMATGFGLGNPTGIEVVDEEPGKVPVPATQVDATNLAIGQGDSLVTPIQVARFMAALGNGGTLYRPQAIEKITGPAGETLFSFAPEEQGTLPIKPETLKFIQEAMVGVVRSQKPVGTAYYRLSGLDIPIAGKTGTAESAAGDSHAWFAGYTFAEREDKPDIAIAVLAENGGEGSEIAAPIFRRVVELWFYGRPLKLYRWEATFDVTRSPTPIITETPTPAPGQNP